MTRKLQMSQIDEKSVLKVFKTVENCMISIFTIDDIYEIVW